MSYEELRKQTVSLVNHAPPMPDDFMQGLDLSEMQKLVKWRMSYVKNMTNELNTFVKAHMDGY